MCTRPLNGSLWSNCVVSWSSWYLNRYSESVVHGGQVNRSAMECQPWIIQLGNETLIAHWTCQRGLGGKVGVSADCTVWSDRGQKSADLGQLLISSLAVRCKDVQYLVCFADITLYYYDSIEICQLPEILQYQSSRPFTLTPLVVDGIAGNVAHQFGHKERLLFGFKGFLRQCDKVLLNYFGV